MIFHPSACPILLLLLHGGYPDPTRGGQPTDSTRFLRHDDVDSPAPTSYSPTTDRPSLPIPSYSPTQSFKVADLIAPSPNCAPIGSRSSPSSDEKPTPPDADDRRYPPPSIGVTKTPMMAPSYRPKSNEDPTDVTFRRDPPTEVTFLRGDLRKDISRLGIKVSKGITVRVVANAGRFVNLANGAKSSLPFHSSPDGAAVFPLTNGGYVYVSNSEVPDKKGGVYGVYFDEGGNVIDYKQLLSGTTRNCSGGASPWHTYVSCEEYGSGQCYQVDPDPASVHHLHPQKTVLGGKGGNFEAVACDNRDPSKPIFFLTEDAQFGALRRFTPNPGNLPGWDTLHTLGGTTDYLLFLADGYFTWTCDENAARKSQSLYYPNTEGIVFWENSLYFVSKSTFKMFKLDLDKLTYTSSSTNSGIVGDGEFLHQPDQIVQNRGSGGNSSSPWLYFTEDGGRTVGVYSINTKTGTKYSIFEAYGEKYYGDETTGLAFSPDGSKMYACFQDCGCDKTGDFDCGCLLELTRDDGMSFDGETMALKFHKLNDGVE